MCFTTLPSQDDGCETRVQNDTTCQVVHKMQVEKLFHAVTVFANPREATKERSISSCHCRLNFWNAATILKRRGHPNWKKKKVFWQFEHMHTSVAKFSMQSGVSALEKTTALSGSSSVAQPDDCKLCEWLFPWFCGFVQLEQWPHCNPRLFTFQQISSYWNHGEGRAGVKEDSHAPYLCKTNTRLTWGTHFANSPQGSNTWGWQWLINTSCDQSSVCFEAIFQSKYLNHFCIRLWLY